MSSSVRIYTPLRLVTGVIMLVWAGLHLNLGLTLARHHLLPTLEYFFFADAALVIVGAVIFFLNLTSLLLPVLVLNWANYILLTESRVFPAPVIGRVLPVNSTVVLVFWMDVAIIVLSTLTWFFYRRK